MTQTLGHKLSVGISTDLETDDGGVEQRERSIRVALSSDFTRADVELMQKDLESIAQIAQRYPDEVLAVHSRILEHDFSGAREIARRIGLTEEALVAQRGGKWGVVIVVAIAAAVLLEHD